MRILLWINPKKRTVCWMDKRQRRFMVAGIDTAQLQAEYARHLLGSFRGVLHYDPQGQEGGR